MLKKKYCHVLVVLFSYYQVLKMEVLQCLGGMNQKNNLYSINYKFKTKNRRNQMNNLIKKTIIITMLGSFILLNSSNLCITAFASEQLSPVPTAEFENYNQSVHPCSVIGTTPTVLEFILANYPSMYNTVNVMI